METCENYPIHQRQNAVVNEKVVKHNEEVKNLIKDAMETDDPSDDWNTPLIPLVKVKDIVNDSIKIIDAHKLSKDLLEDEDWSVTSAGK